MGGSKNAQKGKIDYPEYMKVTHADWLASMEAGYTNPDTLSVSVTETMSAALGASPYTPLLAYNPNGELSSIFSALSAFGVVDVDSYLSSLLTTVTAPVVAFTDKYILSRDIIEVEGEQFKDLLDNQLDAIVLPRYTQGRYNINAVLFEAYTQGQVLLRSNVEEETAKYKTDLQELGASERTRLIPIVHKIAMKVIQMKLEYSKAITSLTLAIDSMIVIARKEELEQVLDIEEQDHLWDLEVYQYGGSVMASIRGAVTQDTPKPNKALSAAMGALSGALMGAQIGSIIPGIGTVIGAVIGAIIGGIAGYLSA